MTHSLVYSNRWRTVTELNIAPSLEFSELPALAPTRMGIVTSRVGVAKAAEMETIRIGPSWMPCTNS